MNEANKAYVRQLTVALVAYGVVLVGVLLLIGAHPHAAWRPFVAILPMLPALLVPVAVVRRLRAMDELQRRMSLEALGFAFGATAVVTFAYGFLQLVGFPQVSWLMVWPVMAIFWLVGQFLSWRRYR